MPNTKKSKSTYKKKETLNKLTDIPTSTSTSSDGVCSACGIFHPIVQDIGIGNNIMDALITQPIYTSDGTVLMYQKTRRSKYVAKFFNRPVTVLPNNPLFQVYIDNINQFFEYPGIHSYEPVKTYADCFIHVLFSLGLRDVSAIREDSNYITSTSPRYGISEEDIRIYLATSFDRPLKDLTYQVIRPTLRVTIVNQLIPIFSEWLKNNYSTVLIMYKKSVRTLEIFGHIINVFMYNSELWIFDPQKKQISKDLHNIVGDDHILTSVSLLHITNLTEAQPLMKTKCQLNLRGGGGGKGGSSIGGGVKCS